MIGYIQIDAEGRVTLWNQVMERWTQISARQARSQPLLDILPELAENNFAAVLKNTLRHGQTFSLSYLLHNHFISPRTGERFPQSAEVLPILEGDQIVGAEIIIRDMRNRIIIEDEFARQIHHLETLRNIDRLVLQGAYRHALRLITRHTVQAFQALHAEVYVPAGGTQYRLFMAYNPDRIALPDCIEDVHDTLLGDALHLQHSYRVLDLEKLPERPPFHPQARAASAHPLIVEGETYGVLYLECPRGLNLLGDAQAMLEHFADVASLTLHTMEIRAREARRLSELETIDALHSRLRRAESPEKILEEALDFTMERLEADAGLLVIREPEHEAPIVRARSLSPEETERILQELEHPAAPEALPTYLAGEITFADLPGDEQPHGWWLFLRRQPAAHFNKTHQRLLTVLGQSVANAWYRAHLYARTLKLHRQVRAHAQTLERQVAQRTHELRRQNVQNEAILNAAAEGILFVDLEGRVQYANQSMHQICNLAEIQAGLPLAALGFSDEVIHEILLQAQARNRYQTESRLQPPAGRASRDVHLTAVPLLTQDNTPEGLVLTVQDITHQKEIDRLKDNFIATISHELRTPVTNIKLYTENLPLDDPDMLTEFATTLRHESRRLEELIENVLTLSRIRYQDAGQRARDRVDLPRLLETLVEDRQRLAAEKGLRLSFSGPEEGCPRIVRSDRQAIWQCAANLVENAIKYTAEGEVLVRLSCDARQIHIEVCDTGPGISPEDLPYIFDRFYRGRSAEAGSQPGSGLGLAIVRELVQALGGEIQVSNREQGGAVFRISLPSQTVDD